MEQSSASLALTKEKLRSYLLEAKAMIQKKDWLQNLPLILPRNNLEKLLEKISLENPYEFSWSVCFDVDFIGMLMYYGFLTMCESVDDFHYVLFPKLHHKRCILLLTDLHIPKRIRKVSNKFKLSVNLAFERVCDGIIRQHGENWFYPPLVRAFKEFNSRGASGGYNGKVKMISFELWDENDKLVAGEVGYIFGSIYTSLSGFKKVDSAGTVQLIATGCLLELTGFDIWDLGMGMDYKYKLGAKDISRYLFLKYLIQNRTKQLNQSEHIDSALQVDSNFFADKPVKMSARAIIDSIHQRQTQAGSRHSQEHVNEQSSKQLSKSAQKKIQKLEKKRAKKPGFAQTPRAEEMVLEKNNL